MCIRGRKKCITSCKNHLTGCRNNLTSSEKLRASWYQKLRSLIKKHLMRKCTRCLTFTGGETRIRTGDKGFAGLCLTTWPSRHMKKAETNPAEKSWSGLRGSNPRPQPWQGCALPTALSPRTRGIIYANLATNASENMKFMQTFCFGCFFRTCMGLNLPLRIKTGMCKFMHVSTLMLRFSYRKNIVS